jgi:hypothetical protein
MDTTHVGAAEILDKGTDINRKPTPEDSAMLAAIYRRLNKASKDHSTAISDYRKALAVWSEGLDVSKLEAEVESTSTVLTTALREARAVIAGLPRGTTAKGGANLQTVVMQFYGPVNRELGKRLSASDARKINTASFGN